jgi:hypothetical protein
MARYAVRRLDEVPRIPPEHPDDVDWFPLQHHFRLTAFGANVYVATRDGGDLIATHAESDQEELYLVVEGEAAFTLDGEQVDAPAFTAIAVGDPTVARGAVARTAGTTVIAIGGPPRERFESSWQSKWFENVPQVEG